MGSQQKIRSYRVLDRFDISSLKVQEENPSPLNFGEVRVSMRAASLNYRDLLVIRGHYNPKLKSPEGKIPLSDGCGDVIEVGPGVEKFKVGDRVIACFMQKWLAGQPDDEGIRSALGASLDGALTTERTFNQGGLVKMPEHLSYEEAATLPCAAVTAWHALVESGQLRAGEKVLLQGTGGVSIFALQFASMMGAEVLITSSSDDKLVKAKELGAAQTVNYKTNPDWEKAVLSTTGGKGVDHIVEVGGAGTLEKSVRAVRIGGHIALIGVLTGAGAVSPTTILMRGVRVQGIYVGSRAMMESMNAAISFHKLHPVIDKVFAFEQAQEAYRYLESGSHFGKVVIKIA